MKALAVGKNVHGLEYTLFRKEGSAQNIMKYHWYLGLGQRMPIACGGGTIKEAVQRAADGPAAITVTRKTKEFEAIVKQEEK